MIFIASLVLLLIIKLRFPKGKSIHRVIIFLFHPCQVSWIRHRDTHILTVGSSTYTSDHRFSTLHRQGTNEWTLQLRDPVKEDAGQYECQVSTKPVRAHVVNLRVVGEFAQVTPFSQRKLAYLYSVIIYETHNNRFIVS